MDVAVALTMSKHVTHKRRNADPAWVRTLKSINGAPTGKRVFPWETRSSKLPKPSKSSKGGDKSYDNDVHYPDSPSVRATTGGQFESNRRKH
jgi:hypothetical protein